MRDFFPWEISVYDWLDFHLQFLCVSAKYLTPDFPLYTDQSGFEMLDFFHLVGWAHWRKVWLNLRSLVWRCWWQDNSQDMTAHLKYETWLSRSSSAINPTSLLMRVDVYYSPELLGGPTAAICGWGGCTGTRGPGEPDGGPGWCPLWGGGGPLPPTPPTLTPDGEGPPVRLLGKLGLSSNLS